MSSVMKLCGVLTVFTLAVLANPIINNSDRETLSQSTEKIIQSNNYGYMNDGEDPIPEVGPGTPTEDTASVAAEVSAPDTVPGSAEVSTTDTVPGSAEVPTPDTVPGSAEVSTSDTVTVSTSNEVGVMQPVNPDASGISQAPVSVTTKASRKKESRDGEETTPEVATTTVKPEKPATTTAPNGSSLNSPNKISFAALMFMLIVKLFGTY